MSRATADHDTVLNNSPAGRLALPLDDPTISYQYQHNTTLTFNIIQYCSTEYLESENIVLFLLSGLARQGFQGDIDKTLS